MPGGKAGPAMSEKTVQFADGVLDASVHYGVARITLARMGDDGKPQASGVLMVPLVQLPSLTNSLLALVKQIDQRIKDGQAQVPPAAAAEPAAMPGSFTFGQR